MVPGEMGSLATPRIMNMNHEVPLSHTGTTALEGTGSSNQVPCDNLEGWDGGEAGGGSRRRGHRYTCG